MQQILIMHRSGTRTLNQEWKTPRPLTIGSRIAFKAKFLGKELSYRYEIKVYEPGQQLVMQTAEGPFPMKTIYTWRTYNDHACTMTLRNVGEPSGFSRLFAPFMKLAMKRANANDLKLLESILEQQNF